MNSKTRKLTTTGMLCALAYTAAAVGRIPIILFLKYDPKDIIIAIGGLLFGPLTSFVITLLVSFAEMLTISENGVLGFLMNVVSSCSFACTSAVIYRKWRRPSSVVKGLLCGWGAMVGIMLLYRPVASALCRCHLQNFLSPKKRHEIPGTVETGKNRR